MNNRIEPCRRLLFCPTFARFHLFERWVDQNCCLLFCHRKSSPSGVAERHHTELSIIEHLQKLGRYFLMCIIYNFLSREEIFDVIPCQFLGKQCFHSFQTQLVRNIWIQEQVAMMICEENERPVLWKPCERLRIIKKYRWYIKFDRSICLSSGNHVSLVVQLLIGLGSLTTIRSRWDPYLWS